MPHASTEVIDLDSSEDEAPVAVRMDSMAASTTYLQSFSKLFVLILMTDLYSNFN